MNSSLSWAVFVSLNASEEQSDSQSISQENEDPPHPLLAGDLVRDDIYTFIMSTEAEIKDKGKSDWLAKSLVLVQTSWFVMQCIAQAIERLLSLISKS